MSSNSFFSQTHITLRGHREIQRILIGFRSPLKICYVAWTRLYPDGYRASLSNRSDWINHYYNQGYYNVSKCDRHPSCYDSGYTIWDLWEKNTDSHTIVGRDSKENFNLGHGISFILQNGNFCDIFDFCSHASDYDINGYYIHNIMLLKEFINYFYDQAEQLIEDAVKSKFKIEYDKAINIYKEEPDLVIIPFQRDFNYLFEDSYLNSQISTLSKRHLECLKWLIKGKTIVEIAMLLGISKRTVEKHIDAIKNKLECSTLFQAGVKASQLLEH